MILELTYEEVTALNSAAERMRGAGGGGVAAPPEAIAALDERLPLQGDIAVDSPAEQARLLRAMDVVLDHLKQRMDTLVVEQYVGADDPVNAYFDYANVLTVRHRLYRIGLRMQALDEVIRGSGLPDDDASAAGESDAPDGSDAPDHAGDPSDGPRDAGEPGPDHPGASDPAGPQG